MISEPLIFVDQNKNAATYLKHNITQNIGITKNNLASKILQSTN